MKRLRTLMMLACSWNCFLADPASARDEPKKIDFPNGWSCTLSGIRDRCYSAIRFQSKGGMAITKQVTVMTTAADIAVSPTGKRIALYDYGKKEIVIYELDEEALRMIGPEDGSDFLQEIRWKNGRRREVLAPAEMKWRDDDVLAIRALTDEGPDSCVDLVYLRAENALLVTRPGMQTGIYEHNLGRITDIRYDENKAHSIFDALGLTKDLPKTPPLSSPKEAREDGGGSNNAIKVHVESIGETAGEAKPSALGGLELDLNISTTNCGKSDVFYKFISSRSNPVTWSGIALTMGDKEVELKPISVAAAFPFGGNRHADFQFIPSRRGGQSGEGGIDAASDGDFRVYSRISSSLFNDQALRYSKEDVNILLSSLSAIKAKGEIVTTFYNVGQQRFTQVITEFTVKGKRADSGNWEFTVEEKH